MKRNSRLSLALHALGHMSYRANSAQTSATIAEHAGTNPVVVRRVLGRLRTAGLVESERGHSGGWRLRVDPNEITLADVYIALDEKTIAPKPEVTQSTCSLEHALGARVSKIMAEAEAHLIDRLSGTTIADVQTASLHANI